MEQALSFASYKGYPIGYKVSGKGKTVILVPGFTEGIQIFEYIQAQLSPFFKVISIDLPGTFSSASSLQAEIDWSLISLSDVILAVAQNEKEDSFCVLGHSLGGYIALELATKHPEKLYGLGLLHSTANADTVERKEVRSKSIDFILQNGSKLFVEQIVNNLYTDPFKKLHPEIIQNHLQSAQTIEKETLISQYKAMMLRPGYHETLKKFNKPILILAADEDNIVPLKDSLEQCALPRVSQISILKKTGHIGFVEQPEISASILRKFCQMVFSF